LSTGQQASSVQGGELYSDTAAHDDIVNVIIIILNSNG